MKRICVLVLALGLVACDGGETDGDAGGGTDGGGTDAGGGMPVDVVYEARDIDGNTLAGVTMAVDMADGTRVEQVTDASGQATFSIDWAAGPIDATAHLDGYIISTGVGLTAEILARFEDGGVNPVILNTNVPRTDLVTLSGTVAGLDDNAHRIQVTSSARGATFSQLVGPEYSLEVPPGEAMRLTVAEYVYDTRGTRDYTQTLYGIVTVDIDAISADTPLDIDLSVMPLTHVEVTGTTTAPGAGTPLADGNLFAQVFDMETNNGFGAMIMASPSGADVDYTLGFLQPADAVAPATRYTLQDEPLFSQVTVEGWPTGSETLEFMPPPEIITPAFGVSHPLHDPFVVGRVTAGAETQLGIFDLNQEDRILWFIGNADGSETITIPELPSSASASTIFPSTADLYARPYVCEREGANEFCSRLSIGGRAFDLVP